MDISLSYQAFSFLVMVVCGFLCGLIFDLFRALRRHRKSACSVVAVQDIVFWILEASFVYFVAFKLNYAHIRVYEIVALVIGSWLYFMTASVYLLGFLCTVVSYVQKVVDIIFVPIKKILGFVSRVFARFKKIISMGAKSTFSHVEIMKKRIQKVKNIFTF